jgi:hypothetical protein
MRVIVLTVLVTLMTTAAAAQSARTGIIIDEINKNKAEVERYDPAVGRPMVRSGFKDWLTIAVSSTARTAYYRNDSLTPAEQASLNPVLDSLAASISRKMSAFKPDAAKFAFRNPADERLMMAQLRPSATRRIIKLGLSQANWEIYKDRIGLPSYRFKRGYIWAKDSADDHPFCKLYYISIVQYYEGGGRYGESMAKYEETNLIGCP